MDGYALMYSIPVIDLFAGPGGLGGGFSSLNVKGMPCFRIALSIEKDAFALENRNQRYRKCRAFEVTYVRLS